MSVGLGASLEVRVWTSGPPLSGQWKQWTGETVETVGAASCLRARQVFKGAFRAPGAFTLTPRVTCTWPRYCLIGSPTPRLCRVVVCGAALTIEQIPVATVRCKCGLAAALGVKVQAGGAGRQWPSTVSVGPPRSLRVKVESSGRSLRLSEQWTLSLCEPWMMSLHLHYIFT